MTMDHTHSYVLMMTVTINWWCDGAVRWMGQWSAACANNMAPFSTSTSTRWQDKPSSRTQRRTRPPWPSDLSTPTYLLVRICRSTSFQTLTRVSCRRRLRRTSRLHWAASGPLFRALRVASSQFGTVQVSGVIRSGQVWHFIVAKPRVLPSAQVWGNS